MNTAKFKTANQAIKKVTWLGVWVNVALAIVKIIGGLLVGSLALVADGTHSFSDLASDAAVLVGVRLSSKEPDKTHPYGHGRMETFSAFLIAGILVLVGGYMIYYAAMEIVQGKVSAPSITVIIIASVSVVAKEFLYRITKKVAVKHDSTIIYANAWHHRTDALSSLAVIIGVAAAYWGFVYGDQIAAVAVGVMIIFVGIGILLSCIREISEGSVDESTVKHIEEIIKASDEIAHWHRLRTRFVGREIFVDLHILVDPELSITQAHNISENLENTMHEEITRPVNITVHIEPDLEDFRK